MPCLDAEQLDELLEQRDKDRSWLEQRLGVRRVHCLVERQNNVESVLQRSLKRCLLLLARTILRFGELRMSVECCRTSNWTHLAGNYRPEGEVPPNDVHGTSKHIRSPR